MSPKSTPAPSTTTRDRLLDAAEKLVVEHGALALTLDAVAAEAGVSKGGLLYHFPSKDKLAAALVERAIARVDSALAEASANTTPGAFTRAYIQVTMGDARTAKPGSDPLSTAYSAHSPSIRLCSTPCGTRTRGGRRGSRRTGSLRRTLPWFGWPWTAGGAVWS